MFLVKNSTEFAGDLTLCISYKEAVLSYRIRQLQDSGRFTVDNDQTFEDVNINQCSAVLALGPITRSISVSLF